MPLANTPHWIPQHLATHYKKRSTKDKLCWNEILDTNGKMTIKEYEDTSYQAYEKAAIEYEAENNRHYRSINRVDKRELKTITNKSRTVLITCFHQHYDETGHQPGSTQHPLENLLNHLTMIEDHHTGGFEGFELHKLYLIVDNLSHKQRSRLKSRMRQLKLACK